MPLRLFRAAEGGTIFLDEIGETDGDANQVAPRPPAAHRVSGRQPSGDSGRCPLLAATNRDLKHEVSAGPVPGRPLLSPERGIAADGALAGAAGRRRGTCPPLPEQAGVQLRNAGETTFGGGPLAIAALRHGREMFGNSRTCWSERPFRAGAKPSTWKKFSPGREEIVLDSPIAGTNRNSGRRFPSRPVPQRNCGASENPEAAALTPSTGAGPPWPKSARAHSPDFGT